MKLKVTHVEGSKKGTVETFDLPVVTVGRDPQNALVFDAVKDDRVSTKHAALSEQGGGLIVTDLGSRNGTLVNGQKIQGPTPVPSGGLVQFGEHGPMVMVAYEVAAAAPAPAPAPAKSGGGGCVVVAILLILLLGAGGAAAFFLLRGKGGGDPWASYGPGSTFELVVETKIEKPMVSELKTDMKETLLAKTDESVKVKIETTMHGTNTTSAAESDVPRHPKPGAEPEQKPLEDRRESVTVGAGTFDCRYTKTVRDGLTVETWQSNDVPVPVKTVAKNESMTTTTTLVKLDRK
jgi:hypothetical protein